MRVLVLGVTGMLGNAVFRILAENDEYEVWGAMRRTNNSPAVGEMGESRLLRGVDVLDQDTLVEVMARARPDVVINCVGLVKQLSAAADPLLALPINAMLPHRLARLCALTGARLIHVSTDCVFSGRTGGYVETDMSDAEDLYGKSKFIGELLNYPNAITLRTSIIGHELGPPHGLVDWFLAQEGSVKGYSRAIFSGLPTVELARVMRDVVLPRPELSGLYHVSAEPIAKLTLLRLIADIYGKTIAIVPDDVVTINRSLNSRRFSSITGYVAPTWPRLITLMHDFH